MAVTVELTLEQLADALHRLTEQDIETLELLLEKKRTREILRRSEEVKAGKVVKLKEASAFKDLP
ncbi:MAG: hypothetical protein HY347_04165 [candidate division NC10 bacterium]|nr:hypothetical protein [candidate division NC10 bacterium]